MYQIIVKVYSSKANTTATIVWVGVPTIKPPGLWALAQRYGTHFWYLLITSQKLSQGWIAWETKTTAKLTLDAWITSYGSQTGHLITGTLCWLPLWTPACALACPKWPEKLKRWLGCCKKPSSLRSIGVAVKARAEETAFLLLSCEAIVLGASTDRSPAAAAPPPSRRWVEPEELVPLVVVDLVRAVWDCWSCLVLRNRPPEPRALFIAWRCLDSWR